MFQLPEIGNFVSIIFKKLHFDMVNQGEIERMFLMPRESMTMSKIMTTLLMPIKKFKDMNQIMPYIIWSAKLSNKVSEWCKVYHMKKRNKVSVSTFAFTKLFLVLTLLIFVSFNIKAFLIFEMHVNYRINYINII